ncbi:MAG: UDP-N-acetylmuramoyl-L-alanine--D-glutamate ligase [Mycobacteriaceae bacterium]
MGGTSVLVAGARVSGNAVVRALTRVGARLTVTDVNPEELARVAALGAATAHDLREPPPGTALVVTGPGFPPSSPLLLASAAAGVPVWGDVELAWRCDVEEVFGPRRRWLAVTGTNGKTTTTTMLEKILLADGRSAVACGNIGLTVLEALTDPAGFTDLAVELSSFQLHWAPSVRPAAGAVLNVAEDHLDWHGGMVAYAAAKARALTGAVAVVGIDDPGAAALPVPGQTRRVAFRLGEPGPAEVGWRDGVLVDRAFAAQPVVLANAQDVQPGGPANLLDAAAAAALARAAGVRPAAVAAGLRAHVAGEHRASVVATAGGITWVDDSKATNPHAALVSVLAHPRVVWIAGGLLKGARVDDLVTAVAASLSAVVLLGRDRASLVEALARHAPQVPVVEVPAGDDARVTQPAAGDAVMRAAVGAAVDLARPGDTVVLAPAAASMDQFTDYAHRGRAFADAVRTLVAPGGTP